MELKIVSRLEQVKDILDFFADSLPPLSDSAEYRYQLAEKLMQYGIVVCMMQEETYLAFSAFYANDTRAQTAYLSLIAVNENFRRQHLGQQILDQTIKIARSYGMKTIKLEVYRQNINAIRFYEKNGFRRAEAPENQNSFYMIKNIVEESNNRPVRKP